ncbi:MAG: MFS transporter [Nitrososphaeraceae archaeon]|nr:MFS transporter [Nitrososphaeraceae archaeon]
MTTRDSFEGEKDKALGMRNVFALGLVSFFTDFSTEMILGILPLFIVSNLGAPRTILGGIEGSAELFSYAFRMLSGSLSDKTGKRKIFILIGYGLSTISKPFFAATTGWFDAFLVRASDRVGKGFRTAPRDALIADSILESASGKAFGIHRTMDQAGAIVGPITAFVLLQVIDIRGIFLFSLIPGAIAVTILIFAIKEVAIKRLSKTATIFSNFGKLLRGNRSFVILLIITGAFSLGAYNYSFVLLKASNLGISKDVIPLVYAVINISYTLVSTPTGLVADKIGKEKVLMVGYVVFAVSSLLMILFVRNALYAFVLAAVFGIYMGISDTLQRAVIPRYTSADLRGTAYGIYNIIVGVGFFVSNIMFGYLWDNFSLNAAVMYSSLFTGSAIIGMAIFIKKYPYDKLQVP